MSAPRGVWVWMEQEGGTLHPVGLELLGKGRSIADTLDEPLVALLMGSDVAKHAESLVERGADDVLVAQDEHLGTYLTDPYVKVLGDMAEARHPNVLLFGSTPNGRDLAGRLAIRLRTGLTANAVRLDVDRATGLVLGGVPGFGGSVVALIKCERARPQMATVRGGIFRPLAPDPSRRGRGRIERVNVSVGPAQLTCRILERSVVATEDISGVERVLVAGLGTGGDLRLVEEVATLLNAAIGVTRPLVDAGVAPREKQVGSTGIALRGKAALVLGVSGASHFTSGLKDVGTVVAVNTDPKAEIFEHADVCIVGDLSEVLAALRDELKARQEVTA